MILLVAAEAGSAEYLSLVARDYPSRFRFLASEVSRPIFERNGLEEGAFATRQLENISLVLSGASLGHNLDKELHRLAAAAGITSIAIVDHWTFLKERFVDSTGSLVLPDFIILNDDYARTLAEASGLPVNRIRVLGNPVLEMSGSRLLGDSPGTSITAADANGYAGTGKTILFISEQLARDYANGLYANEGYDEYRVLEDLIAICEPGDCVLIKLHPQEDKTKYDRYLSDSTPVVKLADANFKNRQLIAKADIVVGMRSMLLLEASNIRQDVISYRPNAVNTFIGNKLEVTFAVETKEQLAEILHGEIHVRNKRVEDLFSGSREKISNFVFGLNPVNTSI
jgi:hypothetical protein